MNSVKENIAKYAAGSQEDNFCRLCFVKAFKLRNIFPYGDDPNNELFRQICSLALVKLNPAEDSESCICSRCVALMDEFGKWQRQTVECNRMLLEARGGLKAKPMGTTKLAENELLVELSMAKSEKHDSEGDDVDVDPFLAADHSESEQDNKRPQLRNPPRKSVRPAKLASAALSPPKRTKGRKSTKRVKKEHEVEEPVIVSTPLTVKINKARKSLKQKEVILDSDHEYEKDFVESDDSFKPSPSNRRQSKASTSVKRRRIPKGQDDSLDNGGSTSVHSAVDFIVYNAGHGTVNIAFRGYRYFKLRYYRSRSADEIHYGWQCIEDDCNAQIYTRSTVKGSIFWKDRFMNHNHEQVNFEELLTVKIESVADVQDQYSDDIPEHDVLYVGRQRHRYSLVKLPSGEEILVYGDHKHHLLVEKADGTRLFGCVVKTCRAIVYYPPDGKIRIYSGTCIAPEESFDISYRKTQQVIHYEGHYYVYSGRRIDGKCMVWHCYLRKQHNCPTLIYVADGDLVVANRQQVKFAHSHGVGEYKLGEALTIVEGRKGNLPVESTEYDIGKNALGTDFIIFEGLRYTIMNTKVDGTKACRCMENLCGAYIYLTPGGMIVKFISANEHSHPLPDRNKPIDEFDYVIQTKIVERHASLFKWHNGYEYKRQCKRENQTLYYRCVENGNGCMASFTASTDFSNIRENPEQHNHGPVKREPERHQVMLEDDGTTDFKMDLNGDGSEVLKYKNSRYCHFYTHKYGWRVWRCFQAPRCRATLFQNRADGRVFDAERFDHKHDGPKRFMDVDDDLNALADVKVEKRSYSDSDSRESADWF